MKRRGMHLGTGEVDIAPAAGWMRGWLGASRKRLSSLLSADSVQSRLWAVRRLERVRRPWAMHLLVQGLQDDWAAVRWAAAQALARRADSRLPPELSHWLKGDNAHLRSAAVDALASREDILPSQDLICLLDDESVAVRHATVIALGSRRSTESLAPLLRVIQNLAEEDAVRRAALEAVCRILGRKEDLQTEAGEAIRSALLDPSPVVRASGAHVVGASRWGSLSAELVSLLTDPDPYVRKKAVQSLGRVGGKGALAPLQRLARGESPTRPLAPQIALAVTRISCRVGSASVRRWISSVTSNLHRREPANQEGETP